MVMEWSLDFCLVCDQQTFRGAYCSQARRLAELDRLSFGFGPSFPTSNARKMLAENTIGSSLTSTIDLTTYKCSTAGLSQPMTTLFLRGQSNPPSDIPQSSSRALCPSSSQISLSSLQSASSSQSPALSDRVGDELQGYASCFDRVRYWKRRLTAS